MATKPKKQQKKNAPVHKYRVGRVNASIWQNDGENGTFYTATIEARYQDADGDWHSSTSFGPADLLSLAKVADLAHTWIIARLGADASGGPANDDDIPF